MKKMKMQSDNFDWSTLPPDPWTVEQMRWRDTPAIEDMPMNHDNQPSPHRPIITIARCSRKEQNWSCDNCGARWLPEVFVIESDGNLWFWLCPACLGQLTYAANDTVARHARNLEANAS